MGGFAKNLNPGKLFMSQFKPFKDIAKIGEAVGHLGAKPKPGFVPLPPPAAHPATLGSAASVLKSQNTSNGAGAAYYGSTIQTSSQGSGKASTGKATLLGQ